MSSAAPSLCRCARRPPALSRGPRGQGTLRKGSSPPRFLRNSASRICTGDPEHHVSNGDSD
eukprot:214439-Lingulodinium_polyedra.AAC.1